MKLFLDENFLLKTKTAQRLYHELAKGMPIIDYHCHLPPQQIAADELFQPGDLAAQRRLRNEEPLRGSAEVEFLCHGDEGP